MLSKNKKKFLWWRWIRWLTTFSVTQTHRTPWKEDCDKTVRAQNWWGLKAFPAPTDDGVGLCSEGTQTRRPRRDLELGEAPLGAEVLGKKTGGRQAAEMMKTESGFGFLTPPPLPPHGRKTDLDCLFLLGSSAAKMCTVPWSLDTQMSDASWLKLMLKETQRAVWSNFCRRTSLFTALRLKFGVGSIFKVVF